MTLVCLICFGLIASASAQPVFTLRVPQSEGVFAEARAWSNHTQDTIFETGNYSLEYPWVALDSSAEKYTTLGPGESDEWTFYVWAGYHMVQGTAFDLSAEAFAPSQIHCTNFDGTEVFHTTLLAGETRTWGLSATPATASQWRTKGYKLEVTPVPEPASITVLAGLMIFSAFLRRRKH